MNKMIAVVGEGLLAEILSEKLSNNYQILRIAGLEEVDSTTDLVLLLQDTWNQAVIQQPDIPLIRAFFSFGEAVVGPLAHPNTIGCMQCVDKRLLMCGHDRHEMWTLQQILAENENSCDSWVSQSGLSQTANLIEAEVDRFFTSNQSTLEEQIYLINLKTLKSSKHFFLPDPHCKGCGQLPEDSPDLATIFLQASPKTADTYRCRSLDELKKFLVNDYLDYRTGLLNGKMLDFVSPFAAASVNLPLFIGNEATAGRTHSYEQSLLTAILEALERNCGITPNGKKTVIYDSYDNLADQALNPLEAGTHSAEQYAKPDFPFKPFNPDRPLNWVWGYSFLQERPILVPKLLAYYSLPCSGGFLYETSNGCAIGGSLEEAIFYGMMEVIERDSFLMTWYAQLPLPQLNLHSVNDKELHLMAQRIEAIAGYELYLYNATMENKIPSIWAMAKNRNPNGINLICAAGAHLDPIRAVKSAVQELAGMMLTMDEKFEENKDRAIQMYHDSTLVQQMDDHSLLYSLPQAESRLQFLLDQHQPLQTFDEAFQPSINHPDLKDDLVYLIESFKQCKLDVIVVNQTTAELNRNGLHCVKVLIPGMLPMTFGQHLIRLTGLERVLHIPMKLGYKTQSLTIEQLNPYPHPFP